MYSGKKNTEKTWHWKRLPSIESFSGVPWWQWARPPDGSTRSWNHWSSWRPTDLSPSGRAQCDLCSASGTNSWSLVLCAWETLCGWRRRCRSKRPEPGKRSSYPDGNFLAWNPSFQANLQAVQKTELDYAVVSFLETRELFASEIAQDLCERQSSKQIFVANERVRNKLPIFVEREGKNLVVSWFSVLCSLIK